MDAVALEAVFHDAPDPDTTGDGFVNLIWKDRTPSTPDPTEEAEEPIEGCTLDVGWMKVAYQEVAVDMNYYYLRNRNAWDTGYSHPLEVTHA